MDATRPRVIDCGHVDEVARETVAVEMMRRSIMAAPRPKPNSCPAVGQECDRCMNPRRSVRYDRGSGEMLCNPCWFRTYPAMRPGLHKAEP